MPGPGQPNDCVGWITIQYFADGSLSTSGNIGDTRFALALLENARDAVRGEAARRAGRVIIPARDVDVTQSPDFPTRPIGDMALADRGDFIP